MWSQTARKAGGNHLVYFPRQDIHWDIQNLLYSRRLKRERDPLLALSVKCCCLDWADVGRETFESSEGTDGKAERGGESAACGTEREDWREKVSCSKLIYSNTTKIKHTVYRHFSFILEVFIGTDFREQRSVNKLFSRTCSLAHLVAPLVLIHVVSLPGPDVKPKWYV